MTHKLRERRRELEQEMERGLSVMEERTGCYVREARRLLARWEELNAEYGQVMKELNEGNGDALLSVADDPA